MVTSPPAAFIKLDQKIEPLFGKYTPAIENVLSVVGRAPGIVPLSHWGTVRREGNGRRRNERIIQCLRDILWKTCAKSSALWREYDAIVEAGRRIELQAAWQTSRKRCAAGSQACDRSKLYSPCR
jgi:hypothetical protein